MNMPLNLEVSESARTAALPITPAEPATATRPADRSIERPTARTTASKTSPTPRLSMQAWCPSGHSRCAQGRQSTACESRTSRS